MQNIIIAAVIVISVGVALYCIFRAKKKGQKCIGCPYCCECGNEKSHCGGNNKKNDSSLDCNETKPESGNVQ